MSSLQDYEIPFTVGRLIRRSFSKITLKAVGLHEITFHGEIPLPSYVDESIWGSTSKSRIVLPLTHFANFCFSDPS